MLSVYCFFRYYLKVLWIPNNEALNVWTHLIPSVYFMWQLVQFIEVLYGIRLVA